MATSMEPKPEDVYANTNTNTQTKHDTNMFEERFSFRRSSDLPPPIPSKEGITTLNRTGTGTKPKVTPIASLGSPRTHPGPRITSRDWDSKDCSFETIESSTKDETRYKDTFLLHDTLKCLAVKESTQKAANVTINSFICLTHANSSIDPIRNISFFFTLT